MEVKLISVCLLKCFSGLLKTDMQRNGTKASEQQSKNNELVLCVEQAQVLMKLLRRQ